MTYLYPYLGNGPYWRGSPEEENCKKNWWANIVYINNIYPEIQDQVQISIFYFILLLQSCVSYHNNKVDIKVQASFYFFIRMQVGHFEF